MTTAPSKRKTAGRAGTSRRVIDHGDTQGVKLAMAELVSGHRAPQIRSFLSEGLRRHHPAHWDRGFGLRAVHKGCGQADDQAAVVPGGRLRRPWLPAAGIVVALCLFAAEAAAIPLPSLRIGLDQAESPQQVSTLIEILLIFTVLSMAPAILLMMTCFTRLIVAFSFLKHAMGTQQTPPSQILIGLSLFLTIFIMTPVFSEMHQKAISPYLNEEIGLQQAFSQGMEPLRQFMFKQTRERDLALFLSMAKIKKPATKDEVPTSVLIPAFMISELKTAFQIGFVLFLPFLIIDMVVASVLLSMGMMMLPPVMVSLPFKLLLFVLVDGWHLIVGSLVKSFGV